MKEDLRAKYKLKRREFSKDQNLEMSSAIAGLFFQNFSPVDLTHVFISIAKFHEVDTKFIIEGLQHNDHVTCASSCNIKERKLSTVAFTSETEFKVSDFGIPEPVGGPHIQHSDINRVIVPLLAYDTFGNRVGYGAGIYDRFLAECGSETEKIGVSFFEPEELIDGISEFDVSLDAVITPSRVIKF